MKLHPFVQVDGVSFSSSAEDIIHLKGAPEHTARNSVGLNELDYGDEIYRFQDSGRLEEITKRAPVLYFGQEDVPFRGLMRFVRERDPEAFARAGFVISPRFGIAFDPEGSDWVTALAEHCIETWRQTG